MSGCTNRQLGDKLYAYELDLLDDQTREQVEVHLLECEHCRQLALQFEPTTQLLRHDPEVRARIDELAGGEEDSRAISTESRSRSRWATFVPYTVAAAIALMLLILKPWQLEFRPSQEATAADNRLAIMYFDNLTDRTDSTRTGEIATNLLITGLSQSSYLEVMSSQRLYDLLRLLGHEGQKNIDRSVASDIAGRANARWMLVGSILQIEPTLVLTSQLVDVKSGKVKAAQRIDGEAGESIFTLVDRLSALIKDELPLPPGARTEMESPVAQVTTSSPAAYRCYLEGVEYTNKVFRQEAIASFEKAIRLDTTFAMAYFQLASLSDRKYIDKAMQFIDRASRRDGYFIRSRKAALSGDGPTAIAELQELIKYYPDEKEAYNTLGNYKYSLGLYQEAIAYLNQAIEIDPLYEAPYNRLCYAYDAAGDFDKALESINRYIAMSPEEPNPYDSRADLYAAHNKIGEAIDSYRKALQLKPDFYFSMRKLGELAVFGRDFALADSALKELATASDRDFRPIGRMDLGLSLMAQCRLADALRVLDQGMAADSLEVTRNLSSEIANKLYVKSRIHLALGDSTRSLAELTETIRLYAIDSPNDKLACRNLCAQLLAETGKLAQAQQVVEELRRVADRSKRGKAYYYHALGSLALAKGDLDSARSCFATAVGEMHDFYALYMYARTLLASGRAADAIPEFEKLLDGRDYWYICYDLDYHDAGYYLGVAYEETGNSSKAAEQYQKYLAFWQKNHPNLPLAKDAAARLARLKASSPRSSGPLGA